NLQSHRTGCIRYVAKRALSERRCRRSRELRSVAASPATDRGRAWHQGQSSDWSCCANWTMYRTWCWWKGQEAEHLSRVAQNRPPNRGRPKQCCSVAACESADVRDPFLSLRLGCGSGLCRKLEHCCLLTFEHVSEEHHLPVWKFQRIMVCPRVVLVDLPEDGSRVIDCIRFPPKQPALPTPHLLGKGELRSRKNTNCC